MTINIDVCLQEMKLINPKPFAQYSLRIELENFVAQQKSGRQGKIIPIEKRIRPNRGIGIQKPKNSTSYNNKIHFRNNEQSKEVITYKINVRDKSRHSDIDFILFFELEQKIDNCTYKTASWKYCLKTCNLNFQKCLSADFYNSGAIFRLNFLLRIVLALTPLQKLSHQIAMSGRQSIKRKIKILCNQKENLKKFETQPIIKKNPKSIAMKMQDYEEMIEQGEEGFYERISLLFSKSKNQHRLLKSYHMIVLVHGLKGNSIDMKKIRESLEGYEAQKRVFIFSKANEMKTHLSLQIQGQNLASELFEALSKYHQINRISFIAHSLGGLIVRAALPYLSSHADKMDSFVTMSTPHIGFLQKHTIVNMGIKLFIDYSQNESIKQLLFEDENNIQQCYIFRLACQQGMNWFKKIILFSSPQDKYVPIDSARIQNNLKIVPKYQQKIINNLLEDMTAEELTRVTVNFKIEQNSFDNMIGRTAHLKFLQDTKFLSILQNLLNRSWSKSTQYQINQF